MAEIDKDKLMKELEGADERIVDIIAEASEYRATAQVMQTRGRQLQKELEQLDDMENTLSQQQRDQLRREVEEELEQVRRNHQKAKTSLDELQEKLDTVNAERNINNRILNLLEEE